MEVPKFANEDEERDFWAKRDSIDFLDGAEQVNLEYERRNPDVTGTNSKTILCPEIYSN